MGRPTIGNCDCIQHYDGTEELIWHVSKGKFIDITWLHSYLHQWCNSGCPMYSAYKSAIRVGISVKRYTILKMSPKILHNTNLPKLAKWVPKGKNYRTTKKKGRATFKLQSWLRKSKYNLTTKKKVLRLFKILAHQKNFTQLLYILHDPGLPLIPTLVILNFGIWWPFCFLVAI